MRQSLTPIDMLTPAQTCDQLGVDEQHMIEMVNGGKLAAYKLGDNIRFKSLDVLRVARLLAVA